MKMKRISVLVALLQLGFCLDVSGAAEAEKSRIEGNVGIGVIFINYSDNLDPNGSKKLLESLDAEADKELTVMPFILPSLEYDIGKPDGGKLYLNAEPAIDEVGGFAINFGGSHPLAGVGIVDVSVFLNPLERTWKDPYLTDVGRESTSSSKYGTKVALNRILDTGLHMNVVYMNNDVDDDAIAKLQPDLARDGAVYALNTHYNLFSSPTFELRPRLSVRKGEYDGESNSFVKGKVDLEARYTIDRLTLLPRIFYSRSTYDKIDPIFAETRKNDGYGALLTVSYAAPLNLVDWSLQGLIGYSRGDSNITFYDNESVSTGIILSYRL
jgi:hypothetical protein